jgi:hypothetical protein
MQEVAELEARIETMVGLNTEFQFALRYSAKRIEQLEKRVEQLEAALRLTRPYIEMHTLSPNGTMATVLAKIDAALAPEQEK